MDQEPQSTNTGFSPQPDTAPLQTTPPEERSTSYAPPEPQYAAAPQPPSLQPIPPQPQYAPPQTAPQQTFAPPPQQPYAPPQPAPVPQPQYSRPNTGYVAPTAPYQPPYPAAAPVRQQNLAVVSMGEWFGTMLLLILPIVNIIMLFVWSFSSTTKLSKKNFARMELILMGIVLVLSVILIIVMMVVLGGSMYALTSTINSGDFMDQLFRSLN